MVTPNVPNEVLRSHEDSLSFTARALHYLGHTTLAAMTAVGSAIAPAADIERLNPMPVAYNIPPMPAAVDREVARFARSISHL